MAGINQSLVANTTAREGIPKTKTVLKSTLFWRALCTPPNKAVDPIINKEYAVANTGLTPIIYTKIGTAKIDPPLPIKPNEIPTKVAKI